MILFGMYDFNWKACPFDLDHLASNLKGNNKEWIYGTVVEVFREFGAVQSCRSH